MINLKKIPNSPGVYIYRNRLSEIIYVGKAINLKKRVSQYFQQSNVLGPKTKTLVSQIYSIETKIVESEIQALILESNLIKKYLPKYNSLLKDDRSYIYICISKEAIPKVYTVYQSTLPTKSYIYGPFPNSTAVRSLLKSIRQIFPYLSIKKHPKNECLYCHLNLCPGPNPDPIIYRQNIGKIKKLLNGHIKSLSNSLKRDMKIASKDNQFEKAILLRNQIAAINYIVTGWNQLHNYNFDINLPNDQQNQTLSDLITILKPYLNITKINRIECYDISQLGEKYFVGSMVVWQNGFIDKSQYRKFKIKTKFTPDDQFMLKEIIYRRLKHTDWQLPDLIVVDGGKPQISAILPITNIPIIGLSKKEETIVIKQEHNWVDIKLPTNSKPLLLLCSLRDEAHRFANKYRKELMKGSI